jgi:hypothetical protein
MYVETRVVSIPSQDSRPPITVYIACVKSDAGEELGHGMGHTEEGARRAAAQSMIENAAKSVAAADEGPEAARVRA